MNPAPIPVEEEDRLAALRDLELLDSTPEERFDRITRTAARLFDVPIALVNLVDESRLWAKSCVGLDGLDAERGTSFCAQTILTERTLVLDDLLEDPDFATSAYVLSPPHVRFYAGHPVHAPGGHRIGTLCLMDTRPRHLGEDQRAALRDLASWVDVELGTEELSEAIAAQRASQLRLEGIMNAAPDGIMTFDEDFLVTAANAAAVGMFAATGTSLAGVRLTTLLAGDARQTVRAVQDAPVGEVLRAEITGVRTDGSAFPLEVAVTVGEGARGRVFTAVARDITDRRAAVGQLERLRELQRSVLVSAGEAIVGIDEHGRVTFCNPAAEALFRTSADRLVGRRLHDALHHTRADGTPYPLDECPTHRTIRDGQARSVDDERYLRSDGTSFDAEYRSAPIVQDDRIVGAVLTIKDVSDRRQVERLKDEFVSVVSHELRTPLTSIRGSLGLVAGGVFGELPAEAARMIDLAVANTDRLVRLINDLLDLERIASGRAPLQLRVTSAAALVEQAVDAVTSLAADAEVAIEVEVDDVELHVDADRVVQALVNLISNAVKFSAAGASVRVTAGLASGEEGRVVHIAVADRGRGIPADRLERIFERFEQVDASDARDRGGTGLGLSIVRTIAAEHGGRVDVTSQMGVGSTFTLTLPQGDVGAPRGGTPDSRAPDGTAPEGS